MKRLSEGLAVYSLLFALFWAATAFVQWDFHWLERLSTWQPPDRLFFLWWMVAVPGLFSIMIPWLRRV